MKLTDAEFEVVQRAMERAECIVIGILAAHGIKPQLWRLDHATRSLILRDEAPPPS